MSAISDDLKYGGLGVIMGMLVGGVGGYYAGHCIDQYSWKRQIHLQEKFEERDYRTDYIGAFMGGILGLSLGLTFSIKETTYARKENEQK